MADPTPEVYATAQSALRTHRVVVEPGRHGWVWFCDCHPRGEGRTSTELWAQSAEDAAGHQAAAAVDAVWPIAEREVRAKVAAEVRNEAWELRRLAKDAKDRRDDGDPDAARSLERFLAKAVALEQVAARITEGGDTDGP